MEFGEHEGGQERSTGPTFALPSSQKRGWYSIFAAILGMLAELSPKPIHLILELDLLHRDH